MTLYITSVATTTITIASFQNACAECADAIATAGWVTAKNWYAQAEAINSGLDVEASEAGSRSRRRETLAGLAKAIDVAEETTNRAGGTSRFVKTRVAYPS